MAEYTPGPWSHDKGSYVGAKWHVYDEDKDRILVHLEGLEHDPQVEANARLMAAAPEMLDALNKIRSDALAEGGRLFPSTLLQMQGAINKALGQ